MNKSKQDESLEKTSSLNSRYKLTSPSLEDSELLTQLYVIKLFVLVTFVFTLPFGIYSYMQGSIMLAIVLFGMTLLSLLNYLLTTKNFISRSLSANLIIYPLTALMVYLVASGGVHNTGALWIYSLPLAALFLMKFKKGIIVLTLFLILIAAILFLPDNPLLVAIYNFDFKLRLVVVFALVSALASAYQYSIEKLVRNMKVLTKELSEIAEEDQLTQLRNRRGIQHEMERMYAQTKRDKTSLSVIMFDLDFFKDINDRYGHEVGDKVLIKIALVIKGAIRATDVAARWGGEEFLVILPNTNEKEAFMVAEKIRKRILNTYMKNGDRQIKLSASAGVASSNQVKSLDALIKLADNYMYEAKIKGRNITCPTNWGLF